MNILYVDCDNKRRTIHTLYLENIFDDVTVTELLSASKAISFIDSGKEFDLILVADQTDDGTAGDIYLSMRKSSPTTPFIFYGGKHPDMINGLDGLKSHNPKNGHILSPISPADFKKCLLNTLMPSSLRANSVSAFQKIKLIHFLRFNKVLCNVYLKLSDRKYVKVINANCKYLKADIDKFREKKVEHLFIRGQDFEKFQTTIAKTPFLILDTDELGNEEIADTLINTHIILQEMLLNIGVNKQVIELANKSITEISRVVDDNPGALSSVFHRSRNQMDYIYDHSYLTSVISLEILNAMKWKTEANTKVLCTASLFHDITLSNPELAIINHKDDPRLQNFSKEEIKSFLNHPFETGDILCSNSFIPEETVDIVRQHHESVDGKGFPNKLNSSTLSTLVCVFILAHEYISKMYKADFDKNKHKEIAEEMQKEYNVGNFKQAMSAFSKLEFNN